MKKKRKKTKSEWKGKDFLVIAGVVKVTDVHARNELRGSCSGFVRTQSLQYNTKLVTVAERL